MCVRILAAPCARALIGWIAPQNEEGAGNTGCALHPRSRVQIVDRVHPAHEHTGSAETLRPSLRSGLRIIARSPRRSGYLLVTVILREVLLPADLTPTSRRQDHTSSPSASVALVSRNVSVHRIPPRVRDDRDPPLSSGETGREYRLICHF